MKVLDARPALAEADVALWRELFPLPSVFLDIETMGLSKTYAPIYLIGLLYLTADGPVLTQYLAENCGDERRMLQAALSRVAEFDTVITFNGDAFDLPFMEYRAQKLRLISYPKRESVDLYRRYAPYCKAFGLENRKLKTLEEFLGIYREDPFTGGQLIELYDEYSATGDERLEKVITLHNFEDVANMPALLRMEGFARALGTAEVSEASYGGDGRLLFELTKPLPLSPALRLGDLSACVSTDCLAMEWCLPLCEEELRYYLPTYKDYYFLPEQGKIVHTSLAGMIPASARRKAKASECYLVKCGCFLKLPEALAEAISGSCGLRLYRPDFGSRDAYLAEDEVAAYCEKNPEGGFNTWIRKML